MARIDFGGVTEEVVTREEFPMDKALQVLQHETIAVIGYGVQGPAQALNLRDNGFRVIVGQRSGTHSWQKALEHGWVPGETLLIWKKPRNREPSFNIFYPMPDRLPHGLLLNLI